VVLRGVVRAFRLVVYVEMDGRLRRRVVKHIAEVTGNVTEQNVPVLQDLFSWEDGPLTGTVLDPTVQRSGQAPSGGPGLRCTGARPYPTLAKTLERADCSYEQVVRGEGIPEAWDREAQRWAC
jgi:hypothetical protein